MEREIILGSSENVIEIFGQFDKNIKKILRLKKIGEFYEKGYTSNKPHVKSAKVSGGVIATWWPHGDVAVYETFARMSQPWINNIPEIDWHGANGNVVIGSAPASSRYTEARLAKPIEEGMFGGIKKNNVPMILNFSEDEKWPEVLPALFP